MDPQELVPLEAGLQRPKQHQVRTCNLASRSCYRAPLRLCRLLALLIVLPTMFITIPLYMRYRVFLGQMYPMSMTDMRLIDSKISPTWCQRQVVRSNATFNAFVVPGPPELSQELVPVSMTRELELEDDMKEYWGFYLLKGSSVTVSACVSYPGASLIMIKGYKHLQECAYIGDDSSEEVEELIEAYNLGLMSNTTFMEKIQAVRLKKIDGKANDPDTMRRHKAGVSFHDPNTATNLTSSENFPTNADITDHDPEELKEILERLHALRQAAKTESLKYYHPPSHLMSLPALHRHRDANVDKEERRFLSFKDIDGTNSDVTKEANTQPETTTNIPIHKDNTHTNKDVVTKANVVNTEKTDSLENVNKLNIKNNSVEIDHVENSTKGTIKLEETIEKGDEKLEEIEEEIEKSEDKKKEVEDSIDLKEVDTEFQPSELKEILERLHALRQAAKTESLKYYHPPSHLMSLPALHRHRDANVDKEERRFLSFKDIDGTNSDVTKEANTQPETTTNIPIHKDNTHTNKDVVTKANVVNTEKTDSLENVNKLNIKNNSVEIDHVENSTKGTIKLEETIEKGDEKLEEIEEEIEKSEDKKKEVEDSIDLKEVDTEFQPSNSIEQNSKEVFEDVLHRLQALGDRGKRVLVKLHETMGVEYKEKGPDKPSIMSAVTGSEEELDRLRKVLVEAIDEEKTRGARQQKRRDSMMEARAKRELMLGQVELTRELNEDDEARDYAAEEGLEPDGYADHHSTVNETTALDMSNSEFWSSFSSSEEALLECDGLVLNLPLTPHAACHRDAPEEESLMAARANALTYRVPANGYYFFVFNSENEVQKNFIRAKFDLQKTRYDVARTKLRECTNSTDSCHLPLDIFSSQKVVLEVPLRDNDSLWNEQFVIISECEPRTSVYIFCVIAVPILIMIFAFQ